MTIRSWFTSWLRPAPAPAEICGDPATASVLHAIPSLPAGERGRAALAAEWAALLQRQQPCLSCEIGTPESGADRAGGASARQFGTMAQAKTALAAQDAAEICLRVHADGAPTGAMPDLLGRARAVLMDMTGAAQAGRAAERIAELRGCGLVPVLRDRYRGDSGFSMLFVRTDRTGDLGPAALDRAFAAARPRRAPPDAATRRYPEAGMPVVVPVFENPTFARMMVDQLREVGFSDIILADNASRSPEMLACLEDLAPRAHVERLEANIGPRKTLKHPQITARLPRYFAATDPDVGFNPALPTDFIAVLKAALSGFDVAKAGFALDISDRDALVADRVEMKGTQYHIWEHEQKFWAGFAGDVASGDPAFRTGLDTTFAVYDRRRLRKRHFLEAVRVGGRFTAQHLPWLRGFRLDPEEQQRYREAQHFSHYQARARPAS